MKWFCRLLPLGSVLNGYGGAFYVFVTKVNFSHATTDYMVSTNMERLQPTVAASALLMLAPSSMATVSFHISLFISNHKCGGCKGFYFVVIPSAFLMVTIFQQSSTTFFTTLLPMVLVGSQLFISPVLRLFVSGNDFLSKSGCT